MKENNPAKNRLVVSRASTAIFLILLHEGISSRKVIVPSDLCYAAIYPVIYSGNTPLFCDVDPVTGNAYASLIRSAINKDSKADPPSALILPHMYGKCISQKEMDEISSLCREYNILLIEDCASSLGAQSGSYKAGDAGDYSVFSFGYSKTIDLNEGGLIISRKDLRDIERLYETLPLTKKTDMDNEAFFSRLYRLIRNNKDQTLAGHIWQSLLLPMKDSFIRRIDDKNKEEAILSAFDNPTDIIRKRRENAELYRSLIRWNDYLTPYVYDEGDVPWRFSLFADTEIKKDLTAYLLDHNVPVSDWYPVVTPIFGIDSYSEDGSPVFPGASYIEDRILNFPLPAKDEDIRSYTDIINLYFEGKNRK